MEQQQTKLPLEWLSSRRTPELHRLEVLCRETAREHRCAQRRLQEVEEAMASEQEKPRSAAAPEASEEKTRLEQLSRKLNDANAELRRYETRMFAYERTMLDLRKENAELHTRCDELRKEVEELSAAALRLEVPAQTELPPLPVIHFPGDAPEGAAAPASVSAAPAQTAALQPARQAKPKTKLEHLGDEVLAELAKLMPRQK